MGTYMHMVTHMYFMCMGQAKLPIHVDSPYVFMHANRIPGVQLYCGL